MSRRSVVVTGIGAVGPFGSGSGDLWAAMTAPEDHPVRGEVLGFDPEAWMTRRVARRADPCMQYAVAAAAQAHEMAGAPDLPLTRTGASVGCGFGALTHLEDNLARLAEEGPHAVSPIFAAIFAGNAPSAAVAMHFGLGGPTQIVNGACASGTYAIGDAAARIATGEADVMFAVGSEGPPNPVVRAAYENVRALSSSGWERPFDRRREGFVFAAGGAALLLESADHAAARGATVLGTVAGWANTSDGFSAVAPTGDGLVRCIRLAVERAGLAGADIAHVNAHGTGTAINDPIEARSIVEALGASPPVTSVKGRLGHMIGAAGVVEVAVSLLAMSHRLLPATAVDLDQDPAIELDIVSGSAREWVPGPVLSNSLGLGGANGSVVVVPAP